MDAVELRLMGPGLLVSWGPLGSQRHMGSRAATRGHLHSLPLRGNYVSTVCTGVPLSDLSDPSPPRAPDPRARRLPRDCVGVFCHRSFPKALSQGLNELPCLQP